MAAIASTLCAAAQGSRRSQVLFEACFEQSLPRSWQEWVRVLAVPVESGQGVVHGFGTSVEIAPLGRFGELLDEIFDKRLFLRAAFAFDDDSPRDADRVPQLLDRLLEADDLGPNTKSF